MVVFVVRDKEIQCELTNTILEVKKEIIKQLELTCPYIELLFVLDRPLRVPGKFNVEPGKMPRTFDRYILDRFAFTDKTIQVDFTEVLDYDPDKQVRKPLMSGGRGRGKGLSRNLGTDSGLGAYVPPSRETSSFNHDSSRVEMVIEPTFELASEEDFPSLATTR
jgi:hypothetical protein